MMNYQDPTETASKIAELKKIDLQRCSLDEVKKTLDAFPVPHNTFMQIAGKHIFRGQVNDNEEPFASISRISYNPKPSQYIQRASLSGETVFYASNGIDTVAHEAIQDEIRKNKKPFYYVTVDKWRIMNPLNIMIVCHSKQALEVGTDLGEALPGLERFMREKYNYNDSQIQAWQMRCEFVADEFAKVIVNPEQDYYFSALFASAILSQVKNCDGILYPSVAYAYKSQNIAYRTSLIVNGDISLKEVNFLKVQITGDGKTAHEVLASSDSFNGDKIIWS